MSPPFGTAAKKIPAPIAGDKEKVITAVHARVVTAGLDWSKSKVRRLVNVYDYRVRQNGWTLGDFILNRAQLDADGRRRMAADPDWTCLIAYADPVGEEAVRRVMAEPGMAS